MTRHIDVEPTFTFDTKSVAQGFNSHVREQLPWYELVTEAVVQIARHYVPEGGLIYDIGAANGNMGRALEPLLKERSASLIGIEPAHAMAETYSAPGDLIVKAAEDVDYQAHDLSVAMLALMFVRPKNINQLLDRVTAALNPGGALVVVERMIPADGYPSIIMSRLTLAAKRAAGASPEEIIEKELSLSGVQRPIAPALLRDYGAVEWFRYGDFAGWVIER